MKIVEMIRHGQENMALADRLQRFTRSVLLTADAAELPARMCATLQHEFLIPQVAMRVWGAGAAHAGRDFAQGASDDVQRFAASLALPYCGANSGFEAAGWLAERPASLAMIPLRDDTGCLGLLVLGSPDPTRYAADMGTEFLARIGELAGAALSRLRGE